jgi:hypothetical protein
MYDGAVGRPHFRRLHPRVPSKARRHDHMLIVDDSRRRNFEWFGQFENEIGLADLPAFEELHRRGHVSRVAFRCSRLHPGSYSVDLILRKRSGIRKFSVPRIGKPRRHLFRFHSLPNRCGPRPCLLVCQHRERPHFTGPVTHLAILLQNPRNLFRKCRFRARIRGKYRKTEKHRHVPTNGFHGLISKLPSW